MASGDIILTSDARPLDGGWEGTTATNDFNLNSPTSGLLQGTLHLEARSDAAPYGQGWPDVRSPFVPSKLYRVTITEL